MIAIIGNLDILELMVIALFSVMIFGRNLPRVAAQVVTQVTRARRALQKVWRESGIGDEIRDVQREIERNALRLRDADPRAAARQLTQEIEAKVREPLSSNQDESTDDPDAARADEPRAEQERRPDWYPQDLHSPSTEVVEEARRVAASSPDPGTTSEEQYAAGAVPKSASSGEAEPEEAPDPSAEPEGENKPGG